MTCEQVDKKVITAIAQQTDRQKFPLVKYYCEQVATEFMVNSTDGQYTYVSRQTAAIKQFTRCPTFARLSFRLQLEQHAQTRDNVTNSRL